MMSTNRRILVLILAASMLALACLPCGLLSLRATPTPAPTVEVSHEAAERFEEKVSEVFEEEAGGRFRLEITEEELTAYIVENLQGIPLAEPQIRLEEDRIHLSGVITQPVQAQLSLTCSVELLNGQVEVRIEEATLAGLPAPGFVLDYVSKIIEESIVDAQANVTITELRILPGRLIIGGTKKSPKS